LISTTPAFADEVKTPIINSLADSNIQEVHYQARNRFGTIIETTTKVQHFIYTDDSGAKVDLDFKINGKITDQRPITKKFNQYMDLKHPLIKKAASITCICFCVTVPGI
jgi:hypothetical protein